jgi:hypothetical protein
MALPPLTHHEILGLVEPFTRRGRRVDLEATDRLARRLVFRPIEHPGAAPLREDLQLENRFAGNFRLTRVVTPAAGPKATLTAEGPDPGELMALVESIAPRSQLRSGPGYAIALGQELVRPDRRARRGAPSVQLILTEGTAQVAGLTLSMRMPTVNGFPADLRLVAEAGDAIELPQDLLAVVGWDWAPLKRHGDEWRSKLRLRGKGEGRSRRAEAKLERTVVHLARTLAEPPRRFHERFVVARWGAALRRTIPLLTCVALIAGALAIPGSFVDAHPGLRLVCMNAPLLIVGLSFTLQEESRIEIPPLPRPSRAPAWRPSRSPG